MLACSTFCREKENIQNKSDSFSQFSLIRIEYATQLQRTCHLMPCMNNEFDLRILRNNAQLPTPYIDGCGLSPSCFDHNNLIECVCVSREEMLNWNRRTIPNDDALPYIEHVDHDTRSSSEIKTENILHGYLLWLDTRTFIPLRPWLPADRRPSAQRTMTTMRSLSVIYGCSMHYGWSVQCHRKCDTVDHLGAMIWIRIRLVHSFKNCEDQFCCSSPKIYSVSFSHRKCVSIQMFVRKKWQKGSKKCRNSIERLSCQRIELRVCNWKFCK